ncbi:MAG: endonuclease III [Bacteroidetes bacterium GWE2_41_25]|nr:MAG: endonuclease III [Bacteroidetes bacterium GWA2_40_15]OFX94805.1 MAG: endonuclease III [Bacteroidetes bacterium GWC2_40_22]OFY00458.1 MAG: endonuclease III [Bacteroidetes bacterium GWE2_41_25]OFY60910.1 MAG: endonuclease III [Bacteroidetes bacterium GWF2_41_9]HBH84277.1 endonuclease III [Bacteroidales bacterium]
MTIRERYKRTIGYFRNNNPDPDTELDYKNPFELIVAVILSAQCTDKRVNMIMPPLMEKFPDAASMAGAKPEELFEYIRSCSYPNNKARHLSGMSKLLTEEFGGKVPSEPSLLQKLPGVGRKTANVVASVLFKKPVMAVDTHVFRVANRIGLTVAKNPISSEIQLTRHIPADLVHKAHHWLLLHGRYICKSRKPLCSMCGLSDFCKYYIKNSGLKAK